MKQVLMHEAESMSSVKGTSRDRRWALSVCTINKTDTDRSGYMHDMARISNNGTYTGCTIAGANHVCDITRYDCNALQPLQTLLMQNCGAPGVHIITRNP